MAKKDPYREFLKNDFGALFDSLDLKDRHKHYLRSRWLDQVLWMESRAGQARNWHYRLRLTTIIGGALIPALVSLSSVGPLSVSSDNQTNTLKSVLGWTTVILGQVVAISAATEQFFNYGERWRHYRRSVESLKTNGWQFLQLTGPYTNYTTHEEAFNTFAGQVEEIIQRDVEVYATQVTQPKKDGNQQQESEPSTSE